MYTCVDQALQDDFTHMTHDSLNNEDYVFDIEFEAEEVEKAIEHLPNGKAAGPDGVSGKHLKFGGNILKIWITRIFNATLLLECIPSSFKAVNISPVYRRKGKDPLNPNSYRGIGVSNVFSKLFEFFTLSRMLPELGSRSFPSNLQTAYQRGISWEDTTYSVFETLSHLTRNGNYIFQIFYDLEKAFDSVEYCILLKRLYLMGSAGE